MTESDDPKKKKREEPVRPFTPDAIEGNVGGAAITDPNITKAMEQADNPSALFDEIQRKRRAEQLRRKGKRKRP